MMALQPVREFKIFGHLEIIMPYREPPPDEFNDD